MNKDCTSSMNCVEIQYGDETGKDWIDFDGLASCMNTRRSTCLRHFYFVSSTFVD